jgi:hypothetical protein
MATDYVERLTTHINKAMKFSCRFVTAVDYVHHIRRQHKRRPIPKHAETN